MATVPSLPTQVSGTPAPSAWANLVQAAVNFFNNPPRARLVQSTSESLPSSGTAWTIITFDTEIVDSDNVHSTTTNTSRCTIVTAGTYDIAGCAAIAANSTGQRQMRFTVNGTALPDRDTAPGFSAATVLSLTALSVPLNVGDYVEMQVLQDSGSTLTTVAGLSVLGIKRVGS